MALIIDAEFAPIIETLRELRESIRTGNLEDVGMACSMADDVLSTLENEK